MSAAKPPKALGSLLIRVNVSMGHSACLDEFNEVEAFLHSRLPPKGK